MSEVAFLNNLLNILGKLKSLFVILFKIKKKRYRNMSHYFPKYHKHLTIYKDGTGILINSFDIVFNNTDMESLKRAINIEDGKKDANFPILKTMRNTDIHDRFDKYGFWYSSENDIISSVSEKYWSDDDENREDMKKKTNAKELRWIFRINRSRVEIGKAYHIIYIMSIPDMFPIMDGMIDMDVVNDFNILTDGSSTSMKVISKIEKFRYTVSFDSGIILESEPECNFNEIDHNKNRHPKLDGDNNIIYKKYICNINKPRLGSKIRIEWKFKGGD